MVRVTAIDNGVAGFQHGAKVIHVRPVTAAGNISHVLGSLQLCDELVEVVRAYVAPSAARSLTAAGLTS